MQVPDFRTHRGQASGSWMSKSGHAPGFWTHQYDLPEGTGYLHGSPAHILSAAAIAAGVALCLLCPRRVRERMIRTLPILLLCMEIFKDLYLALTGHFDVGFLPLHLCSMGIPVFLLSVYGSRAKSFFSEIAMVLILPGAVAAMLFPDWNMYPVWNFMNLYSWVWHGILVLFPLLLLRSGAARPALRGIWKPMVFLAAVVPPVYLFDRKFSCNYLFILWPPEGTPLTWMAKYLGVPGYLAGYAVLVAIVITAVYGIYGAFGAAGSPAEQGER